MHERVRRRRLPHVDVPGGIYFVTTCLVHSMPAAGLADVERYTETLQQQRPKGMTIAAWNVRCWKLTFARRERWLDEQPSARLLADGALAKIVGDAIHHFSDERYKLWSYVVMPSHHHMVFEPLEPWTKDLDDGRSPRERIMQSINRFSARQCNALMGVTGEFWQHESYDHVVRDEKELERVVTYVENNPVKAGLCQRAQDWPWSSAFERARHGEKETAS